MTEAERNRAIALILAECHGNFSTWNVAQTAWSLGYAVTKEGGIGYGHLDRARNEMIARQDCERRAAVSQGSGE